MCKCYNPTSTVIVYYNIFQICKHEDKTVYENTKTMSLLCLSKYCER